MKTLRDIMRYGFLFTVDQHATVAEAVRIMTKNNVGIACVLDGAQLVGVFSERDVVQRVLDRGLDPVRTPVRAVMTTDLVIADADEDDQSAIHKMDQANIRHLPVVSEGQLSPCCRSAISCGSTWKTKTRDPSPPRLPLSSAAQHHQSVRRL
jgi:CBS domain-containing protein